MDNYSIAKLHLQTQLYIHTTINNASLCVSTMYYVNVSAHTYQWIWWCSVVCRKRWRACMRCLHTICCFSLIATPWHTHNTPSNCITCEQEERIKDMRKSFAYFYTFLSWPIVCSRLTMQAICSSVMEQITSGLSSTKHCNMSSTAAQQDRINTGSILTNLSKYFATNRVSVVVFWAAASAHYICCWQTAGSCLCCHAPVQLWNKQTDKHTWIHCTCNQEDWQICKQSNKQTWHDQANKHKFNKLDLHVHEVWYRHKSLIHIIYGMRPHYWPSY